jgi:formate-dependent nitrite reductase membrane component NrfD
MTKSFYFKVTFLAISAGLFTGLLVYGLFDIDYTNSKELSNLFLKSLFTSISTGLILGIINMYLKIGSFSNKKTYK